VQKFRAASGTDPMLWMGETSGAGGATHGAHLVIGRFLGAFWSADKLGAAAATGHSVVMKQVVTTSNPYLLLCITMGDTGCNTNLGRHEADVRLRGLRGGGGGVAVPRAGSHRGSSTAHPIRSPDRATGDSFSEATVR
jgi:hypothetical protein